MGNIGETMSRKRKPEPVTPRLYCGARLPMSPGRMARAIARGDLDWYLKRAGHTCRRPPLPGKKRCRLHGGLSTGAKSGPKAGAAYRLKGKEGSKEGSEAV